MAHLSSLSTQFRRVVEDFTHEWGFVVVRTAYADNDEAQWAVALERLRAYAAPNDGAEMHPNTFALPVMADSNVLDGADYTSVREAFNEWISDFVHRDRPSDGDENEKGGEWPSDVRHDACIVIDKAALASLLKAPAFEPGKIPNLDLEPWVVVVDAKDPASVPYTGGGPYMGFTRARARVLHQLFEDLASRPLIRLSPVRMYDGQIPLYDGTPKGKLIDPPGGIERRYKFPRGTPRGIDGARTMLEEIQRAVGEAAALGV